MSGQQWLYLIGGPGDQVKMPFNPRSGNYIKWAEDYQAHPTFNLKDDPAREVTVKMHYYKIKCVALDTFIGLHESLDK